MRKWFYAGAVAGGFLLLGAAPAQAGVAPIPADPLGGGPLGIGQLGGGLTPDGRAARAPVPRESALFGGGVPLLGGLGGLPPANEAPRTPTGDGTASGMPPGGTAVDPAREGTTGGERRSFSEGGRPVAGEDQDFL